MKLLRILVPWLIAAALMVPRLFGRAVSVDGEWELTTKTKQGEVTWKVLFVQEGESLNVTMTGPKGKEIKGSGTLKEDRIEWSVKVPTPRGDMNITYAGSVQGETMAGEVQRGNLGKSEWAARKSPS
jgi:hypothetical protein